MDFGDPEDYKELMLSLRPGMNKTRDEIMKKLVSMQYTRNEIDFQRGTFRAKGDILEVYPSNTGETSVILIDEVDRSLHTNLVRKFIELFFEKTRNSDTQLIATTQDPNIMDLGLLRQDEIWFVQRENDHSSTIYSLNKFKERFDKVVRNDYLNGRYGAIPMFNGDFSTEEIEDAE